MARHGPTPHSTARKPLANWLLSQGINRAIARVAFQLPGWCEFTLIYLACLKTVRYLSTLLPHGEAELVLEC